MTDTASRTLKLASWNVNGLRAVLKKDPSFTDIVAELDADVLGLQETKLQEGQVELDLPGYHQVWSYAERKGYSGTAVFCARSPFPYVTQMPCSQPGAPRASPTTNSNWSPSPPPRVACAPWSSSAFGSWTCTPPTRRASSPV